MKNLNHCLRRLLGLFGLMLLTLPASAVELKHFQTYTNIDFAQAGVGGIRFVGNGTITLPGVSGTVTKAYLYWHGPQNGDSTNVAVSAVINGITVTGVTLGISGANCYDPDAVFQSRACRADVTSVVAASVPNVNGDRTFLVSGFVPLGNAVNGASLVVIYDDGNAANNRTVVVYDGNDSNAPNAYDSFGWNLTLSGINYTSGEATLSVHASDGQDFADTQVYMSGLLLTDDDFGFYIEGNTVPFANEPYGNRPPGSGRGGLWDILEYDAAPALALNPFSLTFNTSYIDDCYSMVVAVLDLPVSAGGEEPGPNTTPSITCSVPLTIETNLELAQSSRLLSASVWDPEGHALQITWSVDGYPVHTETLPASAPGLIRNVSYLFKRPARPLQAYQVRITVSDITPNPLSRTCDINVLVIDGINPVIGACAPSLTQIADALGNLTVPDLRELVEATDNLSLPENLLIEQIPAPGTILSLGTHAITLTVRDEALNFSSCLATLTVNPIPVPNLPPVAVPDISSTPQNTPVKISVLSNDSDPNNNVLTITSATSPANGTVTLNADKTITYTPATGFSGINTFTYTISDGKGGTASALVTVTVLPSTSTGCDYSTYTQGGWGSKPSGNNPGKLLASNFSKVFGSSGVTIGYSSKYTLKFTSASAVEAFLPQGGTAKALTKSYCNPTSTLSVFAGQVLALKLNVAFSDAGVTKKGLGSLKLASGKLAGKTVNEVLKIANEALGGKSNCLPSGLSISDLNSIVTSLNESFNEGSTGYLLCTTTTPPTSGGSNCNNWDKSTWDSYCKDWDNYSKTYGNNCKDWNKFYSDWDKYSCSKYGKSSGSSTSYSSYNNYGYTYTGTGWWFSNNGGYKCW